MNKFIFSFLILFLNNAFSQKHLRLNELAPKIHITDWILNTPKDKNLEGKYIVLEFWATTCKGCLESVPHLNELQNKFNRSDLYFISITDEEVKDVIKTSKRIDFNSIVVSDKIKRTQIAYGNKEANLVLPLTILIDNKGIIKWIGIPALLNDEVIEKLLNNTLIPFNMYAKPR